ncbi:Galactose oxidase/kelch repeat superfamily protein [Raphanus sativus]|nr:Galactose oxidase/kelch repeat superfamily protein [Raphanus sativus]
MIRFTESTNFDELIVPESLLSLECFRFRNQTELVGLANGAKHRFSSGRFVQPTRKREITENFPVGYSIETMINGKMLSGVLFSTKQSPVLATDQSLSRRVLTLVSKRPAMSNGDHDNSLKISRSLSKDHTDPTESKDSPPVGMEGGGSGLISNLWMFNINTIAGNVNKTAQSSSVPETDEASSEYRNAVSIDVGATNKTGAGESASS